MTNGLIVVGVDIPGLCGRPQVIPLPGDVSFRVCASVSESLCLPCLKGRMASLCQNSRGDPS